MVFLPKRFGLVDVDGAPDFLHLGAPMIFCSWDSKKNPLFIPKNDMMQE